MLFFATVGQLNLHITDKGETESNIHWQNTSKIKKNLMAGANPVEHSK